MEAAKAEDLSLEGLQSLLSSAGNAALAVIRSAEQALEELKAAEDQQRQKKDEEKPAKKTTKKAAAKSKGVESQAPAALNPHRHQAFGGKGAEGRKKGFSC